MKMTCERCGHEFTPKLRGRPKYCPDCRKEIKREYHQRYYATHREAVDAKNRRWREANREVVAENGRCWRKNNPERLKEIQRRSYLKRKQRRQSADENH